MARSGGTAVFRAEVESFDAASSFEESARALGPVVREYFREDLAGQLEDAFVKWAPYDETERDSIHLVDELWVEVSSGGRITATVHSPVRSSEGFAYTDVTRFGRGPIYPRSAKYLRWFDGSGYAFARSVGPWHPGGDWVEDATMDTEALMEEATAELGRVIEEVVL